MLRDEMLRSVNCSRVDFGAFDARQWKLRGFLRPP
jgi:hypothetical protein